MCGCYSIHLSLVCIQSSEGDNSRQQHPCVCFQWVFHGWQGFLFRGGVSAARFQIESGCMCTHCTHLRARRPHSVTPLIQLFIHWKLIRSHFVRQCTKVAALTAARSPFQKCQSSCFSRVLQADPAFMFMKHLQKNPPQPRTAHHSHMAPESPRQGSGNHP